MAIEAVFPENSVVTMSPRISFSHDFCKSEAIPVEQRPNYRSNSSGLNSSIDFDFCVRECFDQESSSADEIFSDGKIKILTREIKKKPEPEEEPPVHQVSRSSALPQPSSLPQTESHDVNVSKSLKNDKSKEIKATNTDSEDKHQSSKSSFWRFKRSSSCGSGYSHSLCPLPLLSRSNSTGSTPNNATKRTPLSKDSFTNKQNSHRNAIKISSHCSSSTGHQKPPLKKIHGSYGNGVQVNPILNVHSGNLFGLGSIFSSSAKDRSKKK